MFAPRLLPCRIVAVCALNTFAKDTGPDATASLLVGVLPDGDG